MKKFGIVTGNDKVSTFIQLMTDADLDFKVFRFSGSKTLSMIEIQGEDEDIPAIQTIVNQVAYRHGASFSSVSEDGKV